MRAVPKDSVKVKGNLTHLAKTNSQPQANITTIFVLS